MGSIDLTNVTIGVAIGYVIGNLTIRYLGYLIKGYRTGVPKMRNPPQPPSKIT